MNKTKIREALTLAMHYCDYTKGRDALAEFDLWDKLDRAKLRAERERVKESATALAVAELRAVQAWAKEARSPSTTKRTWVSPWVSHERLPPRPERPLGDAK